ncbi:unnamed protein product [Sphagnum jensenii]|uniref:DNA 3'-5' helicase n=1 Tax=Sphagnum jensenii TaxID=128206 RepID=A0ABP1B0N2_9BRYO
MRRLQPLWAVGCQLVALTASLSPSQETDLKIAMSTKFTIVSMSTVRPLIGYAVDQVEDVDEEIIRQIVEWDCDVSSEVGKAIVYYFTRQSVERVASVANNVACVRTAHLHAHLEEDAKKAQLQSWLSGKACVLVATGVIRCEYNYPSVRLVIHHGSFRSFTALHQESGRLARDGRPSMSRVISSKKSKAEAMHLDSSFAKPDAWIVDTETCRRHDLHLVVDGQAQRCSIIPAAQPCDNYLCQSRAVFGQPPPILDAQGAGNDARLFHERGSCILVEFPSVCSSRRARLSLVSCLRQRWRLLSLKSKLSDVAGWLPVLQMSRTASEVRLSQFHSPVA